MQFGRGRPIGALAALLVLAGLPASTVWADDWDPSRITYPPKSIAYYQAYDQRLQDVGWKLIRANADFCENTVASIGLQLQDVTTFGKPDIARRALKLSGDFAVATSAKGSPAEASGILTQNREITHLGEVDLNAIPINKKEKWARLKRVHDLLDELLSDGSPVSIRFAGGEEVRVAPVKVCSARFELAADDDMLVGDDERVLIGIKSEVFTYSEDVFAAGLAHELAHTLFGHFGWHKRLGRRVSRVRLTEKEADRLMPWLLINAGFEPSAASVFFRKYQPPSGSFLFFRGSHPKWRDREEWVKAETAIIEPLMASEGKADWRRHFLREIDPNQGRKP
jgi:hypothetical protein